MKILFFLLLPFCASSQCTGYRWSVKIMSDTVAVDSVSRPATIDSLNTITRRKGKGRQPEETKTYTIRGRVIYWAYQQDGDIHISLKSLTSGKTMVCEFPSTRCLKNRQSRVFSKMQSARKKFFSYTIKHHRFKAGIYEVTGTLFFDQTTVWGRAHNVFGHADNYIELHPVINFVRRGK